jgi:predicted SAM-dependent methyltransferase
MQSATLHAPAGPVAAETSHQIKRLNWGCGPRGAAGWLNSDRQKGPGVDYVCDVRGGLPIPSESLDYAVSVHAMQEVALEEQVPVLAELHRVLRPGGVLRLCLPDAEKAIRAYLTGDRDHFVVPDDDFASLGGKFVAHILWYGHSRVMYTFDFAEELLLRAGFARVHRCAYRRSQSGLSGITDLDDRARETLFVEAVKTASS